MFVIVIASGVCLSLFHVFICLIFLLFQVLIILIVIVLGVYLFVIAIVSGDVSHAYLPL